MAIKKDDKLQNLGNLLTGGFVNTAKAAAGQTNNNSNTYRYGSTGDGVKALQNQLIAAGYDVGKAGADGVFGNATANAVKQYQKEHGLAVDGIAGKNTLGSLNKGISGAASNALSTMAKGSVQGAVTAAGGKPDYTKVVGAKKETPKTTKTVEPKATPKASKDKPATTAADPAPATDEGTKGTASGFVYDDFTYQDFAASDLVNQAHGVLQQHRENRPGDYSPIWQDEADSYLSQYQNRDPFSYNFNEDALYQQYKDMYVNQGRLASMDAMGQAAAMTGGYGNSYAQSAGQQAYNMYLNQLNEVVPELYQMAHNRYTQEGQEMLNMYDLYMNRENQEYAKYQDTLDRWYQEDSRLQSDYDNLYNREWSEYLEGKETARQDYLTGREEAYNDYWNNINMDYQKERDKVADEQWEKTFNENKRQSDRDYTLRTYDDDDDDDDDGAYDNGGLSEDKIKVMQSALGVSADGKWGANSQKAAGGLSAEEAYKQFTLGKLGGTQPVRDGYIKKFQSTLNPESTHDTIARSMYGPYTAYVAYMLEKDTTLSDAEKDYLISLYGITSSDRKYLTDKGLI